MWCNVTGKFFIIIARISVFFFNALTSLQWIFMAFAIHFCVMLGWITEQRTSLKKKKDMEWIFRLKMALIYCFCFSYLENGNLILRRRILHSLLLVENVVLVALYVVNSNHIDLIKIPSSVFIAVFTLIGILIIELSDTKSKKATHEEEKPEPSVRRQSSDSSTSTKNKDIKVPDNASSHSSNCQDSAVVLRSKDIPEKLSLQDKEISHSGETSATVVHKRETMCSIQDLLANTSAVTLLYNHDIRENSTVDIVANSRYSEPSNPNSELSHTSINEVGLPIKEESTILPCQVYPKNDCSSNRVSTISMPTYSSDNRLKLNSTYAHPLPISYEDSTDNKISVEFANSAKHLGSGTCSLTQNIDNTNDYESIYVPEEEKITKHDSHSSLYSRRFLPRSLLFPLPSDQNVASFSIASHDYENIATLHAYRGNTGVRHWKPYIDIQSSVHDYSTFKEKSAFQDSTLISGIYTNNLQQISEQVQKRNSMVEKTNSNYSVSLPDLSNIIYASKDDIVTPKKENISNSGAVSTDPPNYETIWYDENRPFDNYSMRLSNMPPIMLFEKTRMTGSLSNLNPSRHSRLPALPKGRAPVMRNASLSGYYCPKNDKPTSELNTKETIDDKIVHCKEENGSVLTNVQSTPDNRKVKRKDSKRTQKSPLMKLVSLGQNSIHEHTARALQVGKKVFQRQRIHVITPKKEISQQEYPTQKREISVPIVTKQYIDPAILKKRCQLSPKNKLILSEASALIRKTDPTFPEPIRNLRKDNSCSSLNRPSSSSITEDTPLTCTSEQTSENGPQHSTPENNRHIPQISILSTISSVASPEEMARNNNGTTSTSSLLFPVNPLTGHLTINLIRCNSKPVNEMSVIEEFESLPSQV